MNNWIPKNNILKLAILIASLSLVLYFAGLFLVLKEERKVENLYYDTELVSFQEKKIWIIESIAETNQQEIQTLRNFLVQKGDEAGFIEQIENVAKQSALSFEIVSLDVRPDGKDNFKEDVAVKISTKGSWQNTMSFLNKLEKMPFGVLIKKINLDSDFPGDWSGSFDFVIFRKI